MASPRQEMPEQDVDHLFKAIGKGKAHLTKFMLAASGTTLMSCVNKEGRTPLMECCYIREEATRVSMVKTIRDAGADVNQRDDSGRTALIHACQQRCNDVVRILIMHCQIVPDTEDEDGNTALIHSVLNGNDVAVELLVRNFRRLGLQIDHFNKEGYTALHIAARNGFIQCAKILATKGKATLTLKDKVSSMTPLETCLASGYQKSEVEFLKPSVKFYKVAKLTTTMVKYRKKSSSGQESISSAASQLSSGKAAVDKSKQKPPLKSFLTNKTSKQPGAESSADGPGSSLTDEGSASQIKSSEQNKDDRDKDTTNETDPCTTPETARASECQTTQTKTSQPAAKHQPENHSKKSKPKETLLALARTSLTPEDAVGISVFSHRYLTNDNTDGTATDDATTRPHTESWSSNNKNTTTNTNNNNNDINTKCSLHNPSNDTSGNNTSYYLDADDKELLDISENESGSISDSTLPSLSPSTECTDISYKANGGSGYEMITSSTESSNSKSPGNHSKLLPEKAGGTYSTSPQTEVEYLHFDDEAESITPSLAVSSDIISCDSMDDKVLGFDDVVTGFVIKYVDDAKTTEYYPTTHDANSNQSESDKVSKNSNSSQNHKPDIISKEVRLVQDNDNINANDFLPSNERSDSCSPETIMETLEDMTVPKNVHGMENKGAGIPIEIVDSKRNANDEDSSDVLKESSII